MVYAICLLKFSEYTALEMIRNKLIPIITHLFKPHTYSFIIGKKLICKAFH